ncbi:MAG: IS1 family transposase [Acidobacteria bacterium]|nr:IS1 family transposase [Acidobacteriota bacterium]
MNKLPVAKRAQVLSLLCEGTSMRAVSRLADVSINTVTKLLVDAGRLCAAFHDDQVRGVKAQRVQVDEIWSFTYAKAKNVPKAKKAPVGAGDTWTWTGLEADSKLIVSWLVGPRDAGSAFTFTSDLKARLANRVQLTSDGLKVYVDAVEDAFGADVDYAQLVKLYGPSGENETRYSPAKCIGCLSKTVTGDPAPKYISTSYSERQNLTMRMHMRRFTRLTNGFSKKLENHVHMVALYTVFYNFTKIHKTLRVTPAMEAGLTDRLWSMEDVVRLLEEVEAPQPAAQSN